MKTDVVKMIEQVTDIQWMKKEDLNKKEMVNMCEAQRACLASKIQQGIVQGKALGKSEGIAEGIELGKTQGVRNANRATCQTMLSKGFTIKQIADIFSVRVESWTDKYRP